MSCQPVTFPIMAPLYTYRTAYDMEQIAKYNTSNIPDNLGNFGQGGVREAYCGPCQGKKSGHRTKAYDDPHNPGSYFIRNS